MDRDHTRRRAVAPGQDRHAIRIQPQPRASSKRQLVRPVASPPVGSCMAWVPACRAATCAGPTTLIPITQEPLRALDERRIVATTAKVIRLFMGDDGRGLDGTPDEQHAVANPRPGRGEQLLAATSPTITPTTIGRFRP